MALDPNAEINPSFKVIVIGAGLAGSLLTNGLINNGVAVTAYERMAVQNDREGYQITLGSPALEGFRACLTPDLIEVLVAKFGRAGGRKSRAPIIYDTGFRPLLDLTKIPNYHKSAPINRRTLRDSLALPVFESGNLVYGKKFERYEIIGAGDAERVRAYFDDGSSDDCDVLIGADGSHSQVNQQIGLNNLRALEQHKTFMVKTELPIEAIMRLPRAVLEKQVLVFSHNITLYFSAYLPDGALDAKLIDHSLKPAVMLAVSIPNKLCPDDPKLNTSEDYLDIVSAAIRNWSGEYHQMVQLVRGQKVYVFRARYSIRPPANWRDQVHRKLGSKEAGHRRVWLLGDACHAMLPSRGMGANQAMRDTASMLPLLVELARKAPLPGHKSADVADACNKYEAEMLPRAFDWVQKSGGGSIVPISTNTILGGILIRTISLAVGVASLWYKLLGVFVKTPIKDDCPEFQD
ncbi:hypothetical protein BX600DRAFT_473299 [Xylariales sp. PMI_506]|nr:hypothetical protein BX600DRAFT_473299 [Xylariales sp. PMI_506]